MEGTEGNQSGAIGFDSHFTGAFLGMTTLRFLLIWPPQLPYFPFVVPQ